MKRRNQRTATGTQNSAVSRSHISNRDPFCAFSCLFVATCEKLYRCFTISLPFFGQVFFSMVDHKRLASPTASDGKVLLPRPPFPLCPSRLATFQIAQFLPLFALFSAP